MSIKTKIILSVIFLAICPIVIAQSPAVETLSKQSPNYDAVFPDNKINTLTLKMSPADWTGINAEMSTKYGAFGARKTLQGAGAPPQQPVFARGNDAPPRPGPRNMPFGNSNSRDVSDPPYVSVSMEFNGMAMEQVGFRLKGNSSLMSSWGNGTYKLPFRLNISKYEKQTLYGFKELSFSPAFQDNSLIREKVASDLFRDAGVPAARTSFCKVYIDFGSGSKYCGIYTSVEVVDDTMIKSQFGEDSGNIYKPESNFVSFNSAQFEKKNNKKRADWSDVESAISILNAPFRETDAPRWRKELETVLNMEGFIKWLAMNTLMTSWDSYGVMPHNYYLYNSPEQKLTWIPWDQNEAMSVKKGGFRPLGNEPQGARPSQPMDREGIPDRPPGGPSRGSVSITLASVALDKICSGRSCLL